MSRQPNILLILSDQHAADVAGYAGDLVVRTQNLDALAAESVQLSSAVCAAPVCTPSRISMLTGKEPHHANVWEGHWPVFPEHLTWPGHFAAHGYRTCLVGKMHVGGKDQMFGFQHRPYGDLRHGVSHQPEPVDLFPGYDHVESAGATEISESMLQDVVVTRETLSFALEHGDKEPETPWFICASYGRPHSPLTAPGRYLRRYRDRVPPVPTPERTTEPYAECCREAEGGVGLSEEQEQLGREAYYACVDFLDDCVGEMLDGLDKAGMLGNTIVIYASDHGEMAGNHGLWGKVVYYDESVRVPLLMRGPGIAPGERVCDAPVSLMDLFPTTCALAGLPVPEGLDGVDQSEILANPASERRPRSYAPSSYYFYVRCIGKDWDRIKADGRSAMRLLRSTEWKYVDIQGGRPLLFDLVNDPRELINLADDPQHAERLVAMQQAWSEGFSWEAANQTMLEDRVRVDQYRSGVRPSTPNQYVLGDGRMFDAEESLYGARWLNIREGITGGIIPQRLG